mmetsp:Transcript_5150/g.14275  ORF Transcript_5150/g.14275 Transcript_5150/m.14275 type:complete len:213 (+) Transcript_5150:780-1418(+)
MGVGRALYSLLCRLVVMRAGRSVLRPHFPWQRPRRAHGRLRGAGAVWSSLPALPRRGQHRETLAVGLLLRGQDCLALPRKAIANLAGGKLGRGREGVRQARVIDLRMLMTVGCRCNRGCGSARCTEGLVFRSVSWSGDLDIGCVSMRIDARIWTRSSASYTTGGGPRRTWSGAANAMIGCANRIASAGERGASMHPALRLAADHPVCLTAYS